MSALVVMVVEGCRRTAGHFRYGIGRRAGVQAQLVWLLVVPASVIEPASGPALSVAVDVVRATHPAASPPMLPRLMSLAVRLRRLSAAVARRPDRHVAQRAAR
ncbi:MAG: hypothetical protein IPP68_12465 [Elusimicrobia bacterium]|nr:hypothetical protein [Elusimicrobiota bacterium]